MSACVGIVGDVMGHLGFGIQEAEGWPLTSVFSNEVVQLCRDHDEMWGNLEGPCSNDTPFGGHARQLPRAADEPHMFVPHTTLAVLRDVGFRVLSVANNHGFDLHTADDPAVTSRYLRAAGIEPAGESFSPVVRVVDGRAFGVFAFTMVINGVVGQQMRSGMAAVMTREDLSVLLGTMRSWRSKLDYVIVMPHWGQCFTAAASSRELQVCYDLLEAGADVIAGSHPHVLWPIISEQGRTVALSLGDFVQLHGCPRFHPAWESVQRSTRSGILSIVADSNRLRATFTPVRRRDNFDHWLGGLREFPSFWRWTSDHVQRWRGTLTHHRPRLRSVLELDGPPLVGEMSRQVIDSRYTTPVPAFDDVAHVRANRVSVSLAPAVLPIR